ncbi:uncharacterized protein ALTATR162_LOCUS7604 [Alternaria atra]|uniref:Uncharacterized protein n=1 Tax=Alternaria atra TaxID=119953 RepID=A0A8J2IE21_9PLEO|nr:uncharacterized protein ALTATR162_LOCUS7604 [Alternaria atra]CAG5173263.1 unnamed protein product [Alternaria atra]
MTPCLDHDTYNDCRQYTPFEHLMTRHSIVLNLSPSQSLPKPPPTFKTSASHYTNNTALSLDEKEQSNIPKMRPSDVTIYPANVVASARGTDSYPRMANSATGHVQPSTQLYPHQQYQSRISHPSHNVPSVPPPPPPPRQPARAIGNAVNDLLPYCTTEPPLSEAQVIALSDVSGSLRELVVLALGATFGTAGCMEKLDGAVGRQAAANIAEFFADEWEIEG